MLTRVGPLEGHLELKSYPIQPNRTTKTMLSPTNKNQNFASLKIEEIFPMQVGASLMQPLLLFIDLCLSRKMLVSANMSAE